MQNKFFTGDRNNFDESWLIESPFITASAANSYRVLSELIGQFVKTDSVINLSNNINMIDQGSVKFFWIGSAENIDVACEFSSRAECYIEMLVGRNPELSGPPYASDLYIGILAATKKPIKLISDSLLSGDGLNLWKRLLSMGHTISVYDSNNPGKSFSSFNNMDDLTKFCSNTNMAYTRYQYVLTESSDMLAETAHSFAIRRYREISGLT